MTQPIELDRERQQETEKALAALEFEKDGLRDELRSVLTRIADLEERKSALDDQLGEVIVRREFAKAVEVYENEKRGSGLLRLFKPKRDK